MAAKIPDFDKYYYEDSCVLKNSDPVCVIISKMLSHKTPKNDILDQYGDKIKDGHQKTIITAKL